MDWIIQLAAHVGPGWKGWAVLCAVVLFLLGLLFERLWFLASLKRDLDEIKNDLPGMKADLRSLGRRVDEAKQKADESIRRSNHTDRAVEALTQSVLDVPQRVQQLLMGGRNG